MCFVHGALGAANALRRIATHRARNNTRRSTSDGVCTLDRRHLLISREDRESVRGLERAWKGFFERKDALLPPESDFTSDTPVFFKYHASRAFELTRGRKGKFWISGIFVDFFEI